MKNCTNGCSGDLDKNYQESRLTMRIISQTGNKEIREIFCRMQGYANRYLLLNQAEESVRHCNRLRGLEAWIGLFVLP